MYNTRILKKTVTGALLAGSVAVTGVGLSIGIAQADPFAAQPHTWCRGQGLPFRGIEWDMGVCHTLVSGSGRPGQRAFRGKHRRQLRFGGHSSPDLYPCTSATTATPHPFCTPRGGLIIIPPICDEIGVYG
jgi:hypothetical protein